MLQQLIFKCDDIGRVKQFIEPTEPSTFYARINPEHPLWGDPNHKPLTLFAAREVKPGVYETGGFNFDHDIPHYTEFRVNGRSYERISKDGLHVNFPEESDLFKNNPKARAKAWNNYFKNTKECYGVADNIDQVCKLYKDAISSTNPVVISFVELNKSDEGEGGWRWHKWGKYIGVQKPQCEYLKDEPIIEKVIVFHIYSVVKKEIKDEI
jgi:hypothetical protein